MAHKAFGIYVHITWHTRLRARCIGRADADLITDVLRQAAEQQSVHIHAMAILTDHVHVIASLQPGRAISPFVRHSKSESARQINLRRGHIFQWARGYFVESVSRTHLSAACTYVAGQHRRHPDRVPS
jgi:REP element-mobilizing transposase RayT